MNNDLNLTETETELTYTGVIGTTSEGLTLIVKKDNNYVDVHEIVPVTMAHRTWQQIKDELATRIKI
jgi:hypothetical protein